MRRIYFTAALKFLDRFVDHVCKSGMTGIYTKGTKYMYTEEMVRFSEYFPAKD